MGQLHYTICGSGTAMLQLKIKGESKHEGGESRKTSECKYKHSKESRDRRVYMI